MYAIDFWNVRARTMAGEPRTNNFCEGWHNRVNSALDSPHPTIWKLFRVIRNEIRMVRAEIFQQQIRDERNQKKKTKTKQKRLSNVVMRSIPDGDQERLQYLKNI